MLTSHVKKILVLALILIAAASYWSYSFIDGDSPLDNLSKSERLDLKKNIVVWALTKGLPKKIQAAVILCLL